jgi:hypothetical protein
MRKDHHANYMKASESEELSLTRLEYVVLLLHQVLYVVLLLHQVLGTRSVSLSLPLLSKSDVREPLVDSEALKVGDCFGVGLGRR